MNAIQRFFVHFSLAVIAIVLIGCSGPPPQEVRDTVELPVRGVKAGAEGIGKGVEGIDNASGNVMSRLLTDQNRAVMVREYKDTRDHLKATEKFIKDRGIVTERADDKLLQDANDRLASVGRQLETKRIPGGVGRRMFSQLQKVRQDLDLIRQRHNTPAYRGYVADISDR
jgi:hypothetical protein